MESYTYSLKNQIGDKEKLGGKLSDEDKTTVEEAVEKVCAQVIDLHLILFNLFVKLYINGLFVIVLWYYDIIITVCDNVAAMT